MTSGLRLLSGPRRRDEALIAAAAWAEDIELCTPAIDSRLGRWDVWQALTASPLRLRQASVAVDGLRSEPHALAELHRMGVLSFVPAADGSFRASAVRFRRQGEARVFIGSGPFAPPGLMAPVDATTFWEGEETAGFSTEVERLLARAREVGHVADAAELAAYDAVYFEAAPERDCIAALAAPMVRRTALDHEVHGLELVTSAKETREAVRAFKTQFTQAATRSVRQRFGHPGGNFTALLHWCAPLGIWALFGQDDLAHNHFFGRDYPDPSRSLQITVKATIPKEGANRKIGGAVARDVETDRNYLVHRGRIGGGRKGVGADLFWSRFRGGTSMREPGREEPSPVVVMGEVGSTSLLRDVAAFVHEVGRIKTSAT